MNLIQKFLLFALLCIMTPALSQAQKLTASDKLRLFDGDDNYLKEYYDAAYKIYKDLHLKYPENADINYKAGKTAFILGRYNEALTFLTKAVALKTKVGKNDADLYLGRAQHMEGLLDEALKSFQAYKSRLKGKKATTDIVNEYIYQVDLAKKLMSMPVNVTIRNMGDMINTEYRESNPSITADGNTFIFTSCRPENTGGQIDPNFGIYYQDIWISEKDSLTGKWSDAELVPGEINTKEHDACLSISADGSVIFIYRSVKGGDIYYSKKKKNGDWRTPEPLEGKANTTYFETGACMTTDKKHIYFVSERPGKGIGNGDIWTAKRTGRFEYEEAVNLGNVVNTVDDENSVFLHPDGKTIYFSSNSKNAIGGYDIFKTEYLNGKWTKPANLGYPINTLGDETHFVITADGKKGYITAKREDTFGDYDIYEVDLENYTIPDVDGTHEGSRTISSGEPVSIVRGKVLSQLDGETLEGTVEIRDESGSKVTETESNEGGEFFVVLEGNKTYTLTFNVKEYQEQTITVFLPQTPGKTEIVNKVVFLKEE